MKVMIKDNHPNAPRPLKLFNNIVFIDLKII